MLRMTWVQDRLAPVVEHSDAAVLHLHPDRACPARVVQADLEGHRPRNAARRSRQPPPVICSRDLTAVVRES